MKNWFFFFSSEHISRIEKAKNSNKENYRTWLFLTVILPLAPFIVSVLIHFFYHGFDDAGTIINNGSLPIISFGIISSGVLYLLEKVDKKDLVIEQIKSRIMAIALLILFLTAALFILQSTYLKTVDGSIDSETKNVQNIILFAVSIILFWYARRVGENMFFIQKKMVEDGRTFDNEVREEAEEMGHGSTW